MKKSSLLVIALVALLTNLTVVPVAIAEESSPLTPAAPKGDAPKGEASKEKEAPAGEEGASKPKGSKDVSGGRFAGDPVYVHLAPMVLPVISDAGVEQIVTLQIDVEVKDFDVADAMHSNMPRVMDALMRALYGGLGRGNLRQGKLVDVTKVKTKATAALDEAVPGGGVLNVLIQGVSQRML